MKISSLMSIVLLLAVLSCATNGQPDVAETPTVNVPADRILIVYLSRTKNTKAVAEIIQQKVGGKLVALELQDPYPADYKTTVDQVARENASGFLPALATRIDSIEKYGMIFLGFPTWGMQLPPPIRSFLAQYNLKGKTIAPFNTNAGYGIGTSFDQVNSLAAGSNVLDGFSTQGGIERDDVLFVMQGDKQVQVDGQVARWLQGLKLP
ncbi:flavodoxin [Dyadobacter sp. LJ53]|uniref:flavodoxin family protein n=1 Tax=Dyadobacter chenwenxiniae TaxID=2906456 RepID=UPI001F2743FB|nr:flavodoxin [Dyadobacter chenwenxiniae]MCF0049318.1 flavodoxin [Dyadobacter chenwenxiniae]